MDLGVPSTMARTRCTLGFHVRFVFLWEWLTLLPCWDFLLHTWQVFAIGHTSLQCIMVYSVKNMTILSSAKDFSKHYFIKL